MERGLKTGIWVIAILAAITSVREGGGQQRDEPGSTKVLEKVKALLDNEDTFKAIEFVNNEGEPEVVANTYLALVDDLYWKEHAISGVVTIARAGIQYSLTKAQELAREDSETAARLRAIAKAMAYNLASYTWPGWDEKGIIISRADLVVGLDAAKLNLRLALELDKGPVPLAIAYWVLGAQYMAAENYEDAVKSFASSREKAREGRSAENELLAIGYIGIAKIVEGTQKDKGVEQLDEAVQGLKELNSDDAAFYIEQLKTALKVVAK